MRSQSKWIKPPPPMKNIHGGPAVNPCTQGLKQGWATLMMARATMFPPSLQRATLHIATSYFVILLSHTKEAKIADLQAQNASGCDAF